MRHTNRSIDTTTAASGAIPHRYWPDNDTKDAVCCAPSAIATWLSVPTIDANAWFGERHGSLRAAWSRDTFQLCRLRRIVRFVSPPSSTSSRDGLSKNNPKS